MLTMTVIQYLLQAANDLSVNWFFHTSGPHLFNNKSGKVMWYSFDEYRKGQNI